MTDSNDKRPVLFGDEETASDRHTARMSERDVSQSQKLGSYIPGYTEQLQANDIAGGVQFASGGEIHGLDESDKRQYYERFGTEPRQLPYRFKPIRTTTPSGEGENVQISQNLWNFKRRGWRAAKKEDFEEGGKFHKLGWEMPPGFQVQPDGTLQRWDTTLFYIEGEKYRRLEAEKHTPEEEKLPRGPDAEQYEVEEGSAQAISYPTGG